MPSSQSPFDASDAPRDRQAPWTAPATTPRRFWREASVEPRHEGFALVLDGRPARTPSRHPLLAPSAAVGASLADEWNMVGDTIDASAMPLTRLMNSAIDGVAGREAEVRDDIVKYAGSDLICYRAAEPDALALRQNELWTPVLDWARARHGARFHLAEGVMFVPQPPETLAAIATAVGAVMAPFGLAALHSATTLTGSAILALALADGALDAGETWRAAHVDEDVQMAIWGEDEGALARRTLRRAEFDAAALLLRA